MTFRMKAAGVALGAAMTLSAGTALAVPQVALMLSIDGSGSISPADFTLQRTAYIAALTNLVPIDGSVAIGVVQFGNNTVVPEFALTTISNQADKDLLIAAFSAANFTQLGGGTPLGPSIEASFNALQAAGYTNNATVRALIDVSTDGDGNQGTNQVVAATAAIAGGVDAINCLGVGAGANCNFELGVGSFEILAANFAAFQTALERKIEIEIRGVPEPTTMAAFGAALIGLAGLRRRKA